MSKKAETPKAPAVKHARSKAKAAPKKAASRVPKPRSVAPKKKGEKGVNSPSRVDVFVREYLVDLNGRQAAIRAGYAPASARQTAAELLATGAVQEAVAKEMVERSRRTGITADLVLQRFWNVATASADELSELRRACCRFCWGTLHFYQWTPQELRTAIQVYEDAVEDGAKPRPVDDTGGSNYDPRKDPNPGCPECFGEGVERVHFKDTRDLSPAARQLFAGVKSTQHGLEVKTHSQSTALDAVAKHLGMFRERVELTGKDGKELGVVVVPAKVPRQRNEPATAVTAAIEEQANEQADTAELEQAPSVRKSFTVRGSQR